MNNSPLVSILMNCYNGSRYLNEAIQSILHQTYKNWEIIFWDNCSTDNSFKIFNSYKDGRFKYFKSNEHTGLGMARYQALNKANGEFIAILDCDDVWLTSKLEKQIIKFNDIDVGIVISDSLFFTDSGRNKPLYKKKYPKSGWIYGDLLSSYFISLPTVIIRKSVINKLDHSFDTQFNHISDLDFILRVAKLSKLAIVKEILAKWRVHSHSCTWKNPEKFIYEKKKLINKLNSDSDTNGKYQLDFQNFKRSVYLREAIALLVNDEKRKARKILSKKIFIDLMMTCLYFCSFFSFSKIILLKILEMRKLNPD